MCVHVLLKIMKTKFFMYSNLNYCMAWNIGGEFNLADWRMYERTAKLNSTNDVCMFACEVLDWDWPAKL